MWPYPRAAGLNRQQKSVVMSAVEFPRWYHGNQYAGESACASCGGVKRHAHWCAMCNPVVAYGYAIVEDAERMSVKDRLILHALGVAWR